MESGLAYDISARKVAETGRSRPSGQPSIRVSKLVFSYRTGDTIIRELDLEVAQGQRIAIVGPSGCGKTTLLDCIAGRLVPQAGSVDCSGCIATIYQDLRLVPSTSALDNVLQGAAGRVGTLRAIIGFPRNERVRAQQLLQRVGLSGCEHMPVYQLSGGEKQRVAIARALMQNPTVLIADEPVAALDDANARAVVELLTDLAQEQNLSVIAVLHDSRLAAEYFDEVWTLQDGEFTAGLVESESSQGEPLGHRAEVLDVVHKQSPMRFVLGIALIALLYAWIVSDLGLSGTALREALPEAWNFVLGLLPSNSVELASIPWSTLFLSLIETVQIALLGTTLGIGISFPVAALAANNVAPVWLHKPLRLVLNAIRTVPSLLWALLFVAAVGFGPLAGVCALAAYSVGYLSKLFYESFEEVPRGAPTALSEIGAGGLMRFVHAVWPAAKPAILSSCLFMLEYNVRAASLLGIVDAGGIGFYIKQYVDFRMFPAVLASLLMILLVVLVLDSLSERIRARLMRAFV